jgi:putative flavoprotein involved in K+ transport
MIRQSGIQESGAADVVIIGAGHSGLAVGHYLDRCGVDHVILERGRVANSWRKDRWDSLRLLTPNWLTRLPGLGYNGPDPEGFMTSSEVIRFISGYARFAGAPVVEKTTVTSVRPISGGYWIRTNRGKWRARAVVLASGAFNKPVVPGISKGIPASVHQLTAGSYKRPSQLPDGGVLVVGASATGLQLAEEIHASGRPVTLSIGEHVRMPRVYRGRDIQYWMKASGILDQHIDDADDINRVRRVPSPQLVGSADRRSLDLNSLSDQGVELVGRLAGVRDGQLQFSGSLRNVCKLADLKMNRLLGGIDEWIQETGVAYSHEPAERPAPICVADSPRLGVDLGSGEIRTVLWATGFRPDYSWVDQALVDRKGMIPHDGGIATAPGLYLMGLPFLRRRKSSFIHGADDDARDISAVLKRYLDITSRFAAQRKSA